MSSSKVLLIRNIDQLLRFKKQFNNFTKTLCSRENFWYDLEWIKKHHCLYIKNGDELFFILVWRNNQIVAVAPFQRKTFGLERLGLRRILFWGNTPCYTENIYKNILLKDTESSEELISIIFNYLFNDLKSEWDEIQLAHWKQEDTVFNEIVKIIEKPNVINSNIKTFYFNNSCTLEETINRKRRGIIKKSMKRIRNDFSEVLFNCYTEIDSILYSRISELHTRRQLLVNMKGGSRTPVFQNGLENRVIRDATRYAEKRKGLRLYTVDLDKNIAAFFLIYCFKEWSYGFMQAFDDRYVRYEVASCLLFHVLTVERERHDNQLIDLSWGENKFKKDFSNHSEYLFTIKIRNNKNCTSNVRNNLLDFVRNLLNIK